MTDYIKDLGWNRLGLYPSKMMEVVKDREVWRINLDLVPASPTEKRTIRKEEEKDILTTYNK